jgi:hypothetical protein
MSCPESFVVMVLGMHRCGTSTVARSLPALGVPLGNNLLPLAQDNPRGHWEDLESLALNEELLRHCHSSYDRFGPLLVAGEADPIISTLQTKAADLVQRRVFQHAGRWAFKDPRTARLLWFWRPALASSGICARYAIALRNPLSAALSLEKRDGIPVEKGCFLWLEHMVPAVLETVDGPRAVIDYDLLLEDPVDQLQRMASLLGLPLSDEDHSRITEYANRFVERGLRHTKFTASYLRLDCRVPRDVVIAYDLLLQTARGELTLDDPEVLDAFTDIRQRLCSYSPAFHYASALEELNRALHLAVGERDAQILSLVGSSERQSSEIESLKREVSGRDSQIASLGQALSEQAISQQRTLAEREAHIALFNQAIDGRDSQIALLEQSVSERDRQIMLLERTAVEQKAQIASSTAMLAERGGELAHAQARELDLRRSMSWRITAVLRWFYGLTLGTRRPKRSGGSPRRV